MSQVDTTAARPTRRRGVTIALWMGQVLLAAGFLMAGGSKLAGADQMVDLFDKIGFGQWFRYLVGTLEVAAVVGLLVPRLAGLAALGLVGLMVGAVATELLIGGNPVSALAFGVLAALVAWGRLDETRALLRRLLRR
jgi:putative oxidoreductase